jgi:hypothetical protein
MATSVGKAISHSVKRAVKASTGELSKRATGASARQLIKPMVDLSLENTGKKKSKKEKKKDKKKKTVEVATTVKAGDKLIELIHKVPLLPLVRATKANPIPPPTTHVSSRYELLGTKLLDQRLVYLAMKEFPGYTQEEIMALSRRCLLNGSLFHFASQYKLEPLVQISEHGDKARARHFRSHIGMLSATRNDVATKFVDDLFCPVIKNFRIFLVQESKPWLSKEEYERLCKKN